MNVLGLIPARGGSKGLPKKNILTLAGKPLIAWTIEAAKGSGLISKVVVSTDDHEIMEISKGYGAEVPFLRPDEIAKDTSPTYDAIYHALKYFEDAGESFDVVALLEPTSPLRKADDIDNALAQLRLHYNEADGIISMGEVHLENPYVCKVIEDGFITPLMTGPLKISRRQDYPKIYFPYGVLYAAKTEVLLKEKTFYTSRVLPYFIERWQNYEIDDLYDLICVESILNHKLKQHQ
jgi:CMP-N,N'-diacetyllegionaminic acid synthase